MTPLVVVGVIIVLGIVLWFAAPRIDPVARERRWMLWVLVPFGIVVFRLAYSLNT